MRGGKQDGEQRAAPPKLVLTGGKKPQQRRPGPRRISREQIEIFLSRLAQTCNVRAAARSAGVSESWAHRRKWRDAAFRNGWAQAIRAAYETLELVMLERGLKGTPKAVLQRDGSVKIMREYSTALAVALLKRHAELADFAAQEPSEEQVAELRQRLLDKLQALQKRRAGEPAGNGGEEDGAADAASE